MNNYFRNGTNILFSLEDTWFGVVCSLFFVNCFAAGTNNVKICVMNVFAAILSYEQGNDFTEGLKCHHFIRAQQQQHTLKNKQTNK